MFVLTKKKGILLNKTELARTLTELIDAPGFQKSRKIIAGNVGISASTLSQYENGRTEPKLITLVKLACEFNVSLDYLIMGEEHPSKESEEISNYAGYVDSTLTRILSQTDRRSWLSGRIAVQLQRMIDSAAQKISNDGKLMAIPGLLDDNFTSIIEKYSVETRIYNTFFDYSISENDSGATPGKFFEIVVNNLRKSRPYRYLLAPTEDWSNAIGAFYAALRSRLPGEQVQKCVVYVAEQNMLTGFGLYKLDIGSLQRAEPIAWEMISEFTDNSGRFAYLIPPTTSIHGDLIFPRDHIDHVFMTYDRMWKIAGEKAR